MAHGRQVDFTADVAGTELARLAGLYTFPDFVKNAEMTLTQKPEGVEVTVYADTLGRQFPCHTKAACWLSHLYYLEKRAQFGRAHQCRIDEGLRKYAHYWGMVADCDKLKGRWEELNKEANAKRPDSDYGFVWQGEDGKKERSLPLWTASQVKDAADWLDFYRDARPLRDRRVIATRILEKAAEYGADISEHRQSLERQAGMGTCDQAAVSAMIEKRAGYARTGEQATQVRKLAAAVRVAPRPSLDPGRLTDLADTVDAIDRGFGIARQGANKYGEALDRPEDVIFAHTFTKTAAEANSNIETTTGLVYAKHDLAKVALDDLEAVFGAEFRERVRSGLRVDPEKFAEELHTLPRPDMQLLDGMLREAGVTPQRRKSAAASLTADQLDKLADAYIAGRSG